MSLTEIIAELPALTVAERQLLVRRALDLDEPGLSPEDVAEVDRRLDEHRKRPESSIPADEMIARLRSRSAG